MVVARFRIELREPVGNIREVTLSITRETGLMEIKPLRSRGQPITASLEATIRSLLWADARRKAAIPTGKPR